MLETGGQVEIPDSVFKTEREKEIIERVVFCLIERLDPQRILLFGSRTGKTFSERSDFDFAVSVAEPSDDTNQAIQHRIDDIRGLYQVDLVYFNEIDNEFKKMIEKTGVKLYERSS